MVRIDVPRWLFADSVGCIVWLAFAIGLEIVAAPALGLPPGAALLVTAGAGALATRAAIGCRHRPMALVVDGRRIGVLAAVGRPAIEWTPAGSRVLGGTVVIRLGAAASGSRRTLWMTPYDARAGSLRRLALALRLHAGPLEA
jgi:hypothetical protein